MVDRVSLGALALADVGVGLLLIAAGQAADTLVHVVVGLVALHDLKEYLGAGEELRGVIAYDVMRPPPPCVTPNQRLLEVLPVVMASEQRNIPVVNTLKENRLIGALGRSEVLGLFSEAIAASRKGEV